MTRSELLAFMRSRPYAVQSSVSPAGAPQAATVGVAVTDDFEVVFDTIRSSRKGRNLAANPAIAFTFGSLDAGATRSVQLEGVAEVLDGPERDRLVAFYLKAFPDGVERQAWPGLVYIRVRTTWLRDSDFDSVPPRTDEYDADALAALA